MLSKPAGGTLSELRNASVAEDVDKLALVGSPLFLSRLVQDLRKNNKCRYNRKSPHGYRHFDGQNTVFLGTFWFFI